jgi:hypothetical protein
MIAVSFFSVLQLSILFNVYPGAVQFYIKHFIVLSLLVISSCILLFYLQELNVMWRVLLISVFNLFTFTLINFFINQLDEEDRTLLSLIIKKLAIFRWKIKDKEEHAL